MANRTAYKSITRFTTSGNTISTAASFPLDELQAMTLTAQVQGYKSDFTAGAWVTCKYGARRAAAGNITAIGSVVTDTLQEDSGGTPAITLDVDTTSQTMRLRVTGITAETWYWKAFITVVYS